MPPSATPSHRPVPRQFLERVSRALHLAITNRAGAEDLPGDELKTSERGSP